MTQLIKRWINLAAKEIFEDEELSSSLKHFIEFEMAEPKEFPAKDAERYKSLSKNLLNLLQHEKELYLKKIPWNIPSLINDKELKLIDLFQFTPLELAQQLTLIDFNLFKKIQPKELLNESWCKVGNNINSPNVLQMIYHFASVILFSFIIPNN